VAGIVLVDMRNPLIRDEAVAAMRKPAAAPGTLTREQEALRMCAMRFNLEAPVHRMLRDIPRDCGWRWVQAMWRHYTSDAKVVSVRKPTLQMSYIDIAQRLQQLVPLYLRRRAGGKPLIAQSELYADGSRTPRLCVKLGIDGTSMWQTSLESINLSFAHDGVWSSKDNVHVCALVMGHESGRMLRSAFDRNYGMQIEQSVTVRSAVGPLRCDMYVCADHVARVRLGQCDGTSSKRRALRLCPYCDAIPEEVLQWSTDPRFDFGLRSTDRRFGFPIAQSPPDLLHGTANVAKWLVRETVKWAMQAGCYGQVVLVETVASKLMDKFASRHRKYGGDVYKLSTQSTVLGLMFQRGWLELFTDPRVVAKLPRHIPKPWVCLRNGWLAFERAFNLLWGHGGCAGISAGADVCSALNDMRKHLHGVLPAVKVTPWAHIFMVHCGWFATQLHLKAFACQAIEGSHRTTKRHFTRSLQATVGKHSDTCGLDQVLHKDVFRVRMELEHGIKLRRQPLSSVDWSKVAAPDVRHLIPERKRRRNADDDLFDVDADGPASPAQPVAELVDECVEVVESESECESELGF
jgi:hypothetical protein